MTRDVKKFSVKQISAQVCGKIISGFWINKSAGSTDQEVVPITMKKKQQRPSAPIKKPWSAWGWFKRHWLKLLLITTVLFGAYGFYLDVQIRQKLEGNTWQLPAQIYARPMLLEVGQELTLTEVIDELKLLSYRKVRTPRRVGEFSASSTAIEVYLRPFLFAEGLEDARLLRIEWKGQRVSAIRDNKSLTFQQTARLEPWLISRLVTSGREDRMYTPLEDVPELLINSLLVTEDRDFYQHWGIAPLSVLRALVANIKAGRAVQGGSTLTQQLVKNLFLTREKSLLRKVNEALMSLLIEVRYSKASILEAYINEIYLGQDGALGIHGFSLASHFYFDRPLSELDPGEIASLIGIIKGPSYYNPRRYPERVEERRNLILRLMFENNMLNRNQYERGVSTALTLASGSRFAKGKFPAFMDRVKRELSEVLADPQLRESGVRVFTTLDSLAQQRAEKAVVKRVKLLQKDGQRKKLQSAMVVTDIRSGGIRAMIGSAQPGFKGFNRALDMKRQIGSVIKPAVYLTALEQPASYHLASPLSDTPLTLKGQKGKDWHPQNSDKKFRGQVALITALSRSLNVPTVRLGMELGLSNVAAMLKRLGVEEDVSLYPALTLGAVSLSPVEVNQMYQTIANEGKFIPLHSIEQVTTASGDSLWQFFQPPVSRVSPEAAYLLNYALHKVTTVGTAKRIRQVFPRINMAGKTGTTDDYRDSWFSGFDKDALVTTWVGRDDNQSVKLTGASGALRIFLDYQRLQQPKSLSRRFPEGLKIAHFSQKEGIHIAQGCPDSLAVPAITDALPLAITCSETTPEKKQKGFWQTLLGL